MLNIHDFAKKPDCEIVRLRQPQIEVICDSTLTSEVMSNSWFESLVKTTVGITDRPEVFPDSASVPILEKFFCSEVIKLSMQAHPWQLLNERAGLSTVLRLEAPILCIASGGNSNLL